MVVTAHHKNNQAYEWDYQQFLDDSLTYIFMMGQQKLEQIVTNLWWQEKIRLLQLL